MSKPIDVYYIIFLVGVDVEAARGEEERLMEEDAQSWLNKHQITETIDPQTG